MRILCFVVCLLGAPLPAFAQHSFSLPPIGGPLPPIGLAKPYWEPTPTPYWEKARPPSWEQPRTTSWNQRHDARQPQRPVPHRGWGFYPQVIYIYEPYPVEVRPEVIIVDRPVERIVEVPVPVERVVAPPPEEPPFVPATRILYLIPGCYVGNVHPREVKLPANCDLAKLTTFTP